MTDRAFAKVEPTPRRTLSVAADGSHDLNGLCESLRTFRQAPPAATDGSPNFSGLLESVRTFRSTPDPAAAGSGDLLRESLRTFRSTPPGELRSQDLNGLRESLRTFRRDVAEHRLSQPRGGSDEGAEDNLVWRKPAGTHNGSLSKVA